MTQELVSGDGNRDFKEYVLSRIQSDAGSEMDHIHEVHYLRDRERGVVWEESVAMAPKDSRFVFLSATTPNVKEFAEWIAKKSEIMETIKRGKETNGGAKEAGVQMVLRIFSKS